MGRRQTGLHDAGPAAMRFTTQSAQMPETVGIPSPLGENMTPLPTPDVLTVYGADWCDDCHATRRYLDAAGVPYRYIDLLTDSEAQRDLDAAGHRAIPVVLVPDGTILVEPSAAELARALRVA
jgi:glutaredoxin